MTIIKKIFNKSKYKCTECNLSYDCVRYLLVSMEPFKNNSNRNDFYTNFDEKYSRRKKLYKKSVGKEWDECKAVEIKTIGRKCGK